MVDSTTTTPVHINVHVCHSSTVPCGYASNIPAVDLSTCTITGVRLWLVLANTYYLL